MVADEWDVYVVNEVREWLDDLDDATHARVVQAIDALAAGGPGLGRPLVDTVRDSNIQNLKELRPGTVRILFRIRSVAVEHPPGSRRQSRALAPMV